MQAFPQYRDEVIVKLTCLSTPKLTVPERRIFLSKKNSSAPIGRTSKRKTSLEATMFNGWFDSAVMSRNHAQLVFDVEKQKVYIKDAGSLHGTFHNGVRLRTSDTMPLSDGDLVTFGVSVDRGSEKYPPCCMMARLEFGTESPDDRPQVFRVPDDTDNEVSSDEDQSIRNSTDLMDHKNRFRLPWMPYKTDSTANQQYPVSNVREIQHDTKSSLPPLSVTPQPAVNFECVDLTSVDDMEEDVELAPFQPRTSWLLEPEDGREPELYDLDSSDDDSFIASSHEDVPGVCDHHISSGESDESEDDLFTEEDEFGEHDDFDDDQGSVDPFEESQDHSMARAGNDLEPTVTIADAPAITRVSQENGLSDLKEAFPSHTMKEFVDSFASRGGTPPSSSQLPPIENHEANPAANESACPSQVRLPSIYETIPMAPAGELELRESPVLPSPPTEQPLPTAMGEVADNERAEWAHASSNDRCDDEISELHENSQPPILEESAWTASGEQFLNSPPKESHIPDASPSPVLDETSAYQFELSKKAAAEIQSQLPQTVKRTQLGIRDIVEESDETSSPMQIDSGSTACKRKAEEISELTPAEKAEEEEEEAILVTSIPKRGCTKKVTWHHDTIKQSDSSAVQSSVSEVPPRPAKRLRRVAEVFGFAALGGVAVMSALIATAPTL